MDTVGGGTRDKLREQLGNTYVGICCDDAWSSSDLVLWVNLEGWDKNLEGNRWENNGNRVRLYFGGLQNYCRW